MKPNVLCVGFAKCGTTTLYDIMKQHPDIYLSGIKEPIYYGSNELVNEKGFGWYQNRYYPKKTNKKIVMEINPILARNVPASKIKLDYGDNTKIIFIIRNPINRTYSEFKMNLVDGTCFPNLNDNLGDSTRELFNNWVKNNFIETKGKYVLNDSYSTKFCESGNYFPKIKDYIDNFGKDNVQIIFFEDFIKEPKKECEKIFEFIGVESNDSIDYNLHSNDGNRLPKSVLTMKVNQVWFLKIYKKILIEKLPFISDDVCKFLNFLTWKVPIIFSKSNENLENMSEESKQIIYNYYYEMISELSNLMDMDLFQKWNIEEKNKVLKK